MKKRYLKWYENICLIGIIIIGFIGQKVSIADLKWISFKYVSQSFNRQSEHINLVGTAIVLIAVMFGIILIGYIIMKKRIDDLEDLLKKQTGKENDKVSLDK